MATASIATEALRTGGPGHPRTADAHLPLVVRIASQDNAVHTMSLQVPNRLLYSWYQNNTVSSEYVPLVNSVILDKIIQLKPESEELAKKFRRSAKNVFGTVSKKSGRARMTYLARPSLISFPSDCVIQVSKLQEENGVLQEENGVLQEENGVLQEENDELREENDALNRDFTLAIEELSATQEAAEHMTMQLNRVLAERSDVVNKGSTYDEVGTRQKKRKLSQFQRAADAALWFGESFGLLPTKLMVKTSRSDEVISLPLGDTITPVPDTPPTREVDEFCAMQTLYLLDRFGVSDEFYHELTQVCKF